MLSAQVFIALGSNLANPLQQIQTAYAAFQRDGLLHILKQSQLYVSKPMGNVQQADFINAVFTAKTNLAPFALLQYLQSIEKAQDRVRTTYWGPRTLDLDLLLYADKIIQSEQLILPHPGLMKREFVVYPLLEIAPDLILPTGESIAELARHCPKNGLQIMDHETFSIKGKRVKIDQ